MKRNIRRLHRLRRFFKYGPRECLEASYRLGVRVWGAFNLENTSLQCYDCLQWTKASGHQRGFLINFGTKSLERRA
jgi:hypothetical protein